MAFAAAVMATGRSERRTYGVVGGAAWEVGLPCGGTIEVLVQPIGDDGFPPSLFAAIEQEVATGRAVTVHTDLATGKSGLEPPVGGEPFANLYSPPRQLLVVGAVQIAQSFVKIADALGIKTTVIDPRSRLF
jgi:xanthine dehydrogenase accessory factor